MNLEYGSLVKNDTWTLVPYSLSLNVVGNNFFFFALSSMLMVQFSNMKLDLSSKASIKCQESTSLRHLVPMLKPNHSYSVDSCCLERLDNKVT